MENQVDKARETALFILKEVNHDKKYANISLKEHLRRAKLEGKDSAFVTQLVYGTLEKQIALDWVIGKFASIKRANPWLENILRMGCYQILYMDRVPDSAACNESVKLAKKYGPKALAGFVNGVLRNIARNREGIHFPAEDEDPIRHLSLTYSFPLWLVEKWVKDFGLEKAKMMLLPASGEGFVTIRVNALKTDKQKLTELLSQQGIHVHPGLYMEEALRLENAADIENNPYYNRGFFTVQGESSMLVTHILSPRKGERILDACSAPGGKAVHIAEKMQMEGEVHAWDIHSHRVDLIAWNATRMGAEIVKPRKQDAQVFYRDFDSKMDRVLIDAPCSGWGVIHKKPDIKLRLDQGQLKDLLKIQWNILTSCSRYVKPGGYLVYSTCTMNQDENQNMIERFLRAHPDFQMDDFTKELPEKLVHQVTRPGMLQLLPSRDGIDGFFISRLRRMGVS